ncbi:MAG: hypothetical protein J5881_02485 [Clostridia bacterium]|nr:hypothetical protein [Clostridia bacterium]
MDKLNKVIISMLTISAILIAIVVALLLNQNNKNKGEVGESTKTQIGEVIYDECTDEYEEIGEDVITTNTEEEKISPNCKITLTKYYKGCKDTINDYISVPQELVNCTEKQLQGKYNDWEIKEFSSNKIVLYREFEGECGEHYILKDNNGKIYIYKINENGKQEEYEKTDVATDYLPEKDKEAIKQGLKVNGKEKLNELIESFE